MHSLTNRFACARRDHGNWMVEWPATKIAESMGLKDSFRELYPNVTEVPGYTWSTVNKYLQDWEFNIPEPQDRIDFIYYKGYEHCINSNRFHPYIEGPG
ncbi:hypothetical protein TELCIR_07715 [Teladorsagia circumcincta]|uniref:Uncharacterized protein n=1 Tax=Teladorsagia circumcincta TaxID=45464 RepID=A0A2G9UJK0_TELCI|nr:hypothetical protein TELCIR_07715 [Teladorsagia circumcincta]